MGEFQKQKLNSNQESTKIVADGKLTKKERIAFIKEVENASESIRQETAKKLEDFISKDYKNANETALGGINGIKKLQKALNLKETGIFGKDELYALIDFQKSNKLDIDGIAGPETQKKLFDKDKTDTPSGDGNHDDDKEKTDTHSEEGKHDKDKNNNEEKPNLDSKHTTEVWNNLRSKDPNIAMKARIELGKIIQWLLKHPEDGNLNEFEEKEAERQRIEAKKRIKRRKAEYRKEQEENDAKNERIREEQKVKNAKEAQKAKEKSK